MVIRTIVRRILIMAGLFLLGFSTLLWARGDLTQQKLNKITIELSNEKGEYVMHCVQGCDEPGLVKFETGLAYRLILLNKSKQAHYFTSYSLARKIFTRKVEVFRSLERMDGKAAEIKGDVTEVELLPLSRSEWYFVPVQTGKADDIHCHISEEKGDNAGKTHADLGMHMSYEIY